MANSSNAVQALSARFITAGSLGEAWRLSLDRLIKAPDTELATSDTAGDFLDWEGVTLVCPTPDRGPRVSSLYPFPTLVSEYERQLLPDEQDQFTDFATIANRIYQWPSPWDDTINQVHDATALLLRDAGSRRAIVQIWNPVEDANPNSEAAPISHCQFYFSVRAAKLNMTVMSRSVDAWLGAVPNMVAFAELQRVVARGVSLPVGQYRQFILSYHLYCSMLPIVIEGLEHPENADGSAR